LLWAFGANAACFLLTCLVCSAYYNKSVFIDFYS
jgi:hypothetical protein